jgi:hypothetical protein
MFSRSRARLQLTDADFERCAEAAVSIVIAVDERGRNHDRDRDRETARAIKAQSSNQLYGRAALTFARAENGTFSGMSQEAAYARAGALAGFAAIALLREQASQVPVPVETAEKPA